MDMESTDANENGAFEQAIERMLIVVSKIFIHEKGPMLSRYSQLASAESFLSPKNR